MNYLGRLIVDNRTRNTTVVIGVPTTLTNASVMDKTWPWSDPQTYTISPVSGETAVGYALEAGLFVNATKDYIQMPVSLTNSAGSSSSGTLSIMTADGNTNPTFVIAQLVIDGQTTNQTVSVGAFNAAVSMTVELDDINIVFTDGGQITQADPGTDVAGYILDKAVDVGIAMLTAA